MIEHLSREPEPFARGEAFGRACAPGVANTVAVYRRLFDVEPREVAERVRVSDGERAEIAGIAAGAGVDERDLLAVNARTELLAGGGPEECSLVAAEGVLMQNWDWHPDLRDSTVVWVVAKPDGTWFSTLTEAGMLAKIGINDAGLAVGLNLLKSSRDGGLDGVPIHVLLRRVLNGCRTVDAAVALLGDAPVSASSAVTVAAGEDVAMVELSPGGANVLRSETGCHTNHFLAPPPGATDTGLPESHSTELRLDVLRRHGMQAFDSHDGAPFGVCRHGDPDEPWAERSVTLAGVILQPAQHMMWVADGPPCTHGYAGVGLPLDVS